MKPREACEDPEIVAEQTQIKPKLPPVKPPERPVRVKPDRATDPLGEVGWYLHRERVRQGKSLGEAAGDLNADPADITAIEQGDAQRLPQGAKVLELLGAYADYLGFEPAPLCEHYRSVLRGEAISPADGTAQREVHWLGDYAQRARNLAGIPRGRMLASLIVAALLGTLTFLMVRPDLPSSVAPSGEQVAQQDRTLTPPVTTGSVPPGSHRPGAANPEGTRSPKIAEKIPAERVSSKTAAPAPVTPVQTKTLPEIAVKETPLARVDKAPVAVPKLERDRLTALIKRDIQKAIKSAPALSPQVSAAPPASSPTISNSTTRAPGQTSARVGAVYGSTASDVRVVLIARAQVWIRVENARGDIVFARTLKPGERYRVPAGRGFLLDARNAGALDHIVNGDARGLLGNPGQIVIGLSLDADKLATLRD